MSVTIYGSGNAVIQVVQSTSTGQASTTSTSFVTTGLSVTITPQSTTSKILVTFSGVPFTSSTNYGYYTIYRNSTNLAGGSTTAFSECSTSQVGTNASFTFLDSPSTTSATTYTVYFKASSGTVYWNDGTTTVSTITAQEISGS